MATDALRVSPEELRRIAKDLEAKADTVKKIMDRMIAIVNSLTGQVWSGDAAKKYVDKFKKLQDDMERIYKMIKEHAEDLVAVAQEFIDAESESDNLIGELVEDVII